MVLPHAENPELLASTPNEQARSLGTPPALRMMIKQVLGKTGVFRLHLRVKNACRPKASRRLRAGNGFLKKDRLRTTAYFKRSTGWGRCEVRRLPTCSSRYLTCTLPGIAAGQWGCTHQTSCPQIVRGGRVYLPNPLKPRMKLRTAGTTSTIKMQGKMQRTKGKIILIFVFAAASSAC